MSNKEYKSLTCQAVRERSALHDAQMAKWEQARNPFEAFEKWVSAGETMARNEANVAVNVSKRRYRERNERKADTSPRP